MGFFSSLRQIFTTLTKNRPKTSDQPEASDQTHRIQALQQAAEACLNSTENELYFEDEFLDIFVNNKRNPHLDNIVFVQIKPFRGSGKRLTVLSFNEATKEVLAYHPQTDFWEDYLLDISQSYCQVLYDIAPDDKRRKALNDRKRIAAILSTK